VGSCATRLVCSSVWIPHLCVCEVVWFLKIIVSLLAEDTQSVSLCPLACALSHSSFVRVHFFILVSHDFSVCHTLLICTRTNGECDILKWGAWQFFTNENFLCHKPHLCVCKFLWSLSSGVNPSWGDLIFFFLVWCVISHSFAVHVRSRSFALRVLSLFILVCALSLNQETNLRMRAVTLLSCARALTHLPYAHSHSFGLRALSLFQNNEWECALSFFCHACALSLQKKEWEGARSYSVYVDKRAHTLKQTHKHIHTHTHAHLRARTHTHLLTHAHLHTHTCAHTHAYTHTHTHTRTRRYTHTHIYTTHTHACARAQTQTHTHTLSHTHTYTHIHTHTHKSVCTGVGNHFTQRAQYDVCVCMCVRACVRWYFFVFVVVVWCICTHTYTYIYTWRVYMFTYNIFYMYHMDILY